MKKHTALVVVLALLVAFGAFWILGTRKASAPAEKSGQANSTAVTTATPTPAPSPSASCPFVAEAKITYQDGSFTPNCVTVKSGSVVTWINKSDQEIQLGANPHPSHTGNREVSGGQYTLSVAAGGQATSTLTTKGTHGYHNHLNPTSTGTIIVQ